MSINFSKPEVYVGELLHVEDEDVSAAIFRAAFRNLVLRSPYHEWQTESRR